MNNLIKLLDKNLGYIEHELMDDTIYISVKSIRVDTHSHQAKRTNKSKFHKIAL